MKKAKDMSKLHESKESLMKENKETMMEKKGYKETEMGKMVKSAKGGLTKSQKKIGKVMREFKAGKLKSGMSDKKVTNPKQAIAIALSEAGKSKMKKASTGDMIQKAKNNAIKNISGAAISEKEYNNLKNLTPEQVDTIENIAKNPLFKDISGSMTDAETERFKKVIPKKRGGGMAERGMGVALSQGGVVRGTGAAIKGIRPAKLS